MWLLDIYSALETVILHSLPTVILSLLADLGRASPKWPILCRLGSCKISTQSISLLIMATCAKHLKATSS